MPKQKDLKRLVRSRMQKTGESYTAARHQIISKNIAAKPSPAQSTDMAQIGGLSDEAVRKKTGRTWSQWVTVLDAIGASSLTHRQIAAHLHTVHELDRWWAQMVTVGFERIRGLREKGQKRDGLYECNKSRTLTFPAEVVFEALASPRKRAEWLPGIALTVRKATPHKSAHFTWPDRTNVEVSILDKGAKSSISIQHRKLPSREEAARLKAWWSKRLEVLAEVLGAC